MPEAKEGDTVRVRYTGTLDDGTVFDNTSGGEPMQFTIGAQEVVPAFERAVVGLSPGDSITVRVPAEEAYGRRNPDRVLELELDQLPKATDPEVGQRLRMRQEDGRTVTARITDVAGETVTVDANHPLAGEDLTFRIRLVSIE